MTACPGYHPTHQAQLEYKWGGRYGGSNCTACSAGMAGQSDTCGAMLFTGAQIRAASDEPIPDPASPGLNLGQVDRALFKLSGGKIDLDVHYRDNWTALQTRIIGGAQAVLQISRATLVDQGYGKGNTFRGGHAICIGADGTTAWFDDPLTGRYPVPWETLKRAAGNLVLNDNGATCGYGFAYVAYTRDIVPNYRAVVHPATGYFGLYTVNAATRTVTDTRRAHTGGFSASCTPPRLFAWPGHTSQRLVILVSGALADQAKRAGVSYAVRATYAEEIP